MKPNLKRLALAADFLENLELPEGAKFDMGSFGTHDASHKPILNNMCGTTACHMGWLTTDPYFRKLGLRSKWSGGRFTFLLSVGIKGKSRITWNGFVAAEKIFGISENQSVCLFSGLFPRTRRQQVAHVRLFIREQEKLHG